MKEVNETAVSTAAPKDQIQGWLEAQHEAFKVALGGEEMAKRFARVALTVIRLDPNLMKCSRQSLLGALMMAAQLKLEFNIGGAYVIPYFSKKTNGYEAQFQIGYQGWIDLFYRHPLAEELYAEVVYSKDEFKIVKGTKREIIHNPVISGERGDVIGYYAVGRLKTGAFNFAFMTKEEVLAHKKRYAPAYSKAWEDAFDEMALKTVIKKALKLLPKSIESFVKAITYDETIRRPVTPEQIADPEQTPAFGIEYDSGAEVKQALNNAQEIKQEATPVDASAPAPTRGRPKKEQHLAGASMPAPGTYPTPPGSQPEPPKEPGLEPEPRDLLDEESKSTASKPDKRSELIALIRDSNASDQTKDAWINAVEKASIADVYSLESQWNLRKH